MTTTDGHQVDVTPPFLGLIYVDRDGSWPHGDHATSLTAEPRSGAAELPDRADGDPGVARSGV